MLENFRIKSENEYNALTPEEKGEYNALKRMYDAEQARKQKEETKAELKAELEATLATKLTEAKAEAKAEALAETENKITAIKDEYDRKLEEAEKAMNRAGSKNPSSQNAKRMEDLLAEKFESADDQHQLIKDLINGKAEIEISNTDMVKVISKPSGSTAPEFVRSVWPGHDSMYGRELVPNYSTRRDTIKFNQYSVNDTLDGIGGVLEGEEKPEFGFNIEPKSEAIIKIAGWVDYTEEMEDDVDGFRSEITREAALAHADVFDYQFYKGNGNQTTQLNGLWASSNVQSFPQGGVTSASNVIDKLVAGLTEIRKNHRGAGAFVVAPSVWQDIYLNKDNGDAYTYPILLNGSGVLSLGGVPVYWSNVFEDGQGIVGDFGRGAAVYTKRGLVIKTSSENKDNFIKNVRTLLVESRETVIKRYADGFLKLDLGGATS